MRRERSSCPNGRPRSRSGSLRIAEARFARRARRADRRLQTARMVQAIPPAQLRLTAEAENSTYEDLSTRNEILKQRKAFGQKAAGNPLQSLGHKLAKGVGTRTDQDKMREHIERVANPGTKGTSQVENLSEGWSRHTARIGTKTATLDFQADDSGRIQQVQVPLAVQASAQAAAAFRRPMSAGAGTGTGVGDVLPAGAATPRDPTRPFAETGELPVCATRPGSGGPAATRRMEAMVRDIGAGLPPGALTAQLQAQTEAGAGQDMPPLVRTQVLQPALALARQSMASMMGAVLRNDHVRLQQGIEAALQRIAVLKQEATQHPTLQKGKKELGASPAGRTWNALGTAEAALRQVQGDILHCRLTVMAGRGQVPEQTRVIGQLDALRQLDSDGLIYLARKDAAERRMGKSAGRLAEQVAALTTALGSDAPLLRQWCGDALKDVLDGAQEIAHAMVEAGHKGLDDEHPNRGWRELREAVAALRTAADQPMPEIRRGLIGGAQGAPLPGGNLGQPLFTLHDRMNQALREQRLSTACRQLPALADNNDAIINLAQGLRAAGVRPEAMETFVRAASFMLHDDRDHPENTRAAQRQLVACALPDTADERDVRRVFGTEFDRIAALMETLPDMVQNLTRQQVIALTPRFPERYIGLLPMQLFHASQNAAGPLLPPAVPTSEAQTWRAMGVVRGNLGMVEVPQDDGLTAFHGPRLGKELKALAASLHQCQGDKKHVIGFIGAVLEQYCPKTVPSYAARDVLIEVVRQLPAFNSHLSVNDALGMVQSQNDRLDPVDQAKVIDALLTQMETMETSRWLRALDTQKLALKAVSQGLAKLPSVHCGPPLCRMMDLRQHWSGARSSGKLPAQRKHLEDAVQAVAGSVFIPAPVALAKAAYATAKGTKSPRDDAVKIAASELHKRMSSKLPSDTAAALSPACTRLFVDGLDRGDTAQARLGLKLLARGAVPRGKTPPKRDACLAAAFGSDPALRGAVVRQLMPMAAKGGGDNSVNSARLIHNLLNAGGHDLSPAEVAAARAQVHATAVRGFGGPLARTFGGTSRAMMDLAVELQRSRMLPQAMHVSTCLALLKEGAGAAGIDIGNAVQFALETAGHLPGPQAQKVLAGVRAVAIKSKDTMTAAAVGSGRALSMLEGQSALRCARFIRDELAPLLTLDDGDAVLSNNLNAMLSNMFHDFDPQRAGGMPAMVEFIAGFLDAAPPGRPYPDHGAFVSGASVLLREVLAKPEVFGELAQGIRTAAVDMLIAALPRLGADDRASLVLSATDSFSSRSAERDTAALPAPLWQAFIRQSPDLTGPAFRALVTAYSNAQLGEEPGRMDAVGAMWKEASAKLPKVPQRELLQTLQWLAAQAKPPAPVAAPGTLHDSDSSSESDAEFAKPMVPRPTPSATTLAELAAALPDLHPKLMGPALALVADTKLPPKALAELAESLCAHYKTFDLATRERAVKIAMTAGGEPAARMLADLARNLGQVENIHVGGPLRQMMRNTFDSIAQPFQTDTKLSKIGLAALLRERFEVNPAEVGPAMLQLAARHGRMKDEDQVVFKQLLSEFAPQMTRINMTRIIEAVAYSDPQRTGIDGKPTHFSPAFALVAEHKGRIQASPLIDALRENVLPTAAETEAGLRRLQNELGAERLGASIRQRFTANPAEAEAEMLKLASRHRHLNDSDRTVFAQLLREFAPALPRAAVTRLIEAVGFSQPQLTDANGRQTGPSPALAFATEHADRMQHSPLMANLQANRLPTANESKQNLQRLEGELKAAHKAQDDDASSEELGGAGPST
ncbi:hypothetical protein HLB44_34910 [Aquincola sp. S2]|uniref:Type III effector protein n=1 Tax=Pseudaquabacterium terrae TaxID=2732868 RepID=A0ABX2EUB2_9BURK|nr:hypothetical protein [Aquabacterium terrae]NRF72188.1 hypothetical protein [Aquabacterium terrae]